jgi:hypothetical protein
MLGKIDYDVMSVTLSLGCSRLVAVIASSRACRVRPGARSLLTA